MPKSSSSKKSPRTKRPTLVKLADAAREIGVSRQAVDDRIRLGKMKRIEVGGAPFVSKADIQKWKDERVKRAEALTRSAIK